MGFPRKDDVYRLYKDKQGAYLLVDAESHNGMQEAIANVYNGPDQSLCGTSVSRAWFAREFPKRVQWDELPDVWQEAFTSYMTQGGDAFDPESIRGFWRVDSGSK